MQIRAAVDAFVGYLVCGFLLLAAGEAACEGQWLLERDWEPRAQIFFGSIALCSGWLVSRIGLALLERKFVRGWLKAPEEFLLADHPCSVRRWKRLLCPVYFRPISDDVRERILQAAGRDGFCAPGHELLEHALAVVRPEPALWRRVDLSRQLGDISRGLCAGFVATAAILVCGAIWSGLDSSWGQADLRKLGYALLSLWEALLMVYRFLKFRRQFTVDVLTGYAELREADK